MNKAIPQIRTIGFLNDIPQFLDRESYLPFHLEEGKISLPKLVSEGVNYDVFIDLSVLPESPNIDYINQMRFSRSNGIILSNSYTSKDKDVPSKGIFNFEDPERLSGVVISTQSRDNLEEVVGSSAILGDEHKLYKTHSGRIWSVEADWMDTRRTKTVVPVYKQNDPLLYYLSIISVINNNLTLS